MSWIAECKARKYWKIDVTGYGTTYATGSEEKAEEWRSHKASWERGVGTKTHVKASEVPVGQQILRL